VQARLVGEDDELGSVAGVEFRIRTAARSSSPVIRRVAAMPSSSGMRTSIRTTSGRVSRASRTAWRPVAASPTTVRAGAFAEERMRLVLADIDGDALREAVETLREAGAEAIGVPTDVADPARSST